MQVCLKSAGNVSIHPFEALGVVLTHPHAWLMSGCARPDLRMGDNTNKAAN